MEGQDHLFELSLNTGAQKNSCVSKSDFEKLKSRQDGSISYVKVNQTLQ